MKKISIILLLMISLFSLILTGCEEVGITPGIDIGNSENQGDTSDTVTGEVDTTKPVITGSQAPLPNSFGWNNTDVTVSFSCADTGAVKSGIKKNTVKGRTLTKEGKNQSVTNTGVLIDAAGNTADPVTISNIHIDKTAPVVTITLPGTGEYVLNQSVTATWSATDTLSGVVSPASGTVSIDTSSVGTKTFTLPAGTAKDKAGNSSLEVTKSYSVIADTEEAVTGEVDTTKPVITGSQAPLSNSFGWNNTDVTVSFSCADTGAVQSGIAINTVSGATLTTEGIDQSVTNTGVCTDVAGNTADPVTISNIHIDKTAPVVTITLPGTGEYVLNQSVTATWSATDTLSGVVSPASGTVSIDTSSVGTKTLTLPAGTAKDKAGNSSLKVTKSYSVIADTEEAVTGEVDTTKPVITGSQAPLSNSFGWNNTDVTVSFSCADTGAVQSGIAINTVSGATLTTEGIDQSVTNTGVCTDVAGNTADPVTISNIHIDKTAPVVTITLPGTGEYVLNQSVTATWSATDTLSGVVSPASGTVSIDTSSVGTKTLTLPAGTAKDKAGNSSLKVTKSYSVIAAIEEPVIEDPNTVYPQKWATGSGTASNPWANDCIQKAYNAVPAGGTIFLKAGYYKLSSILYTETKNFNLIGEGMDKSIIVLDTGNSYGIYIYKTDYCTLKGFTIDGADQGDNTKPTIYIYHCNYTTVEDVEAKNAGSFGIDCANTSYSYFHNIYTHDNYEDGIHPGSSIKGRNTNNTYRDIYCYNNGDVGFDDLGYQNLTDTTVYNNTYNNLQCWDNGHFGIALEYLNGCTLSNSSASGNGRNGIWIHFSEDFNVHDCFVTLSEENGIVINDSDNIVFTNVISKNNNGETGININSSNGTKITSCQSYDDRNTPIQKYGIVNGDTSTADYIELTDCILMPNKIAAIYNVSGTEIVINNTTKMLAKL